MPVTRRRFITIAAAGAALLEAGLARPARAAKKLQVVTSSTDLADIAAQVGGDRVEARSFFQGYQEPEIWVEEVFPTWMNRTARASNVIRIGLFADVWMDTVIEGARNDRVVPGGSGYVDASQGIEVLEVPQGRVDRSQGEIHLQGNPHYLLDPTNAKVVAENVMRGLARQSPADADYFARNARDFEGRIDAAMRRWEEAGRVLKGKKLAAYHKTWSYLAHRFGFEVVGYCEPRPGIEPSPADIRRLSETMARAGARVIVYEPAYSPRVPQAVAREVERLTSRPVTVQLLPAHVAGVPEAKDYFAFIDYILNTLVTLLR